MSGGSPAPHGAVRVEGQPTYRRRDNRTKIDQRGSWSCRGVGREGVGREGVGREGVGRVGVMEENLANRINGVGNGRLVVEQEGAREGGKEGNRERGRNGGECLDGLRRI